MINLEKFIARRKALGLSQQELAAGICTQATLSKLERNGRIPSLKIMTQLCERLDLTLNDLLLTDPNTSLVKATLEKAEFELITLEYAQAKAQLAKINTKDLPDTLTEMTYYYLLGYVQVLGGTEPLTALFYFNQILTDLDPKGQTIFSLLAYTGSGLVYSRQGKNDQAEFYFNKVFKQIYHTQATDAQSVGRILNMLFFCAQFYAKINELKVSNALLDYAYKLSAKYHVTYYVARVLALKAENTHKAAGSPVEVKKLLTSARVFAEFNENDQLLKQIQTLWDALDTKKQGRDRLVF
ncbi:hypothetical protein JCM14202_2971 [Agrilactobacillus composti DSM 18527 = JCM 14202]|uniref:helix-turn-helix domain-containing protein n=1 Tax=Agrilactobacillus composti TaxID=398555 RepID=UPI00042E118B|nr:helix-turn-helix transcriptional regulator [Agrilactobacillus composti]GAF41053.1 hypothetical protein JCM14202_2971 [Agrilactobacillus composti DSM 18527 = JCM 14202]